MGAKKWVTIVTFFCTIIAVFLLLVFKCCKCDIGYDIALAIFGSSLLGFTMSLVEYFAERKRAMDKFWLEAKSVLLQFRKAKFIKFDEPEELVISCITENQNNRMCKKYGLKSNNFLGILESYDNQNRFIEWMEKNEVMSFSESDDTKEILDKVYINRIETYEALIKDVIENYIELSRISLCELDNAYGNLNFILRNKTIRLKAYNDIYDKIRKIRYEIIKQTEHFNLWKENKGNFIHCVNKALDISKMLFEEQAIERNGFESYCIYQKQFDDIEESLEEFRTKINFRIKNEPMERTPVSGGIINFEDKNR